MTAENTSINLPILSHDAPSIVVQSPYDTMMKLLHNNYMPHEIISQIVHVAHELVKEYNFLAAISIGGSIANGGSVARFYANQGLCAKLFHDVDYAFITNIEIDKQQEKTFIHAANRALTAKTECNPEYFCLFVPISHNKQLGKWIDAQMQNGVHQLEIAQKLYLPFGPIFPFAKQKHLQQIVRETLNNHRNGNVFKQYLNMN